MMSSRGKDGVEQYDAVIIGGGPAGLSAALILGRCRRKVLVCDSGTYRNQMSQAMHGFLTRDGIAPLEFLRLSREQLKPYTTVTLRHVTVEDASRVSDGFEVQLERGERVWSRKLLLATGLADQLPDVPGLLELYGKSVHHCPYCDGWEHRDEAVAVIGNNDAARKLAQTLTVWTKNVTLCTNGPADFSDEKVDSLFRCGIKLRAEKIASVKGEDGKLQSIEFEAADALAVSAIFVHPFSVQASRLPAALGCENRERRSVETGDFESTDLPGLYVAGDASRDTALVIVAAAEGANAGFAINRDLLRESLRETA